MCGDLEKGVPKPMKSHGKINAKLAELSARRAEVWKAGRPSNPVSIRDAAEHDRIDLEARIAALTWVLGPEWEDAAIKKEYQNR